MLPMLCQMVPYHSFLTQLAMKNTVWIKEANEFLVSEVALGHPVRICNYADIGHGQKNPFWEGVAGALKDRVATFPNNSFPSAKTCQIQFDKLLAMQQEYKKNYKWKSGSTEDIGEVASGLEEILEQIEEAADHADLDKEAKEGVEARFAAQDAELTRGRVTPKANKKKIPRPEPEGEETLDTMLIKVLAKKCDDTNSSNDRDRKHDMEERRMKMREEEFHEAKRVRIAYEVESRTAREEARADALKRDEMTNSILKVALEAMSRK